MPNIEMFIDSKPHHFTDTRNSQPANFSTVELKYAYSQLQLHKGTAKHCNF